MSLYPKDYSALAERFETHALQAEGFTHVDHIGVACQMLQKYDFLDAAARYGASLKTLAARAGAPGKFNTTLTLAFLSILRERMADTPHASFCEFLEKNPELVSRTLLSGWHSDERLGCQRARDAFVMPDRFRT
ncbi:hypothetical protein [Roseibium marinum]|uniref:Uncharacterized protein n=1 Tax=Roseibium marinum TaxID=281252 RepID=A0A2S3V2C6_9HYPH|nr:hypothetical protein [Roseibium marinum]POF34030.1 hypothetical protein CLV41_101481 [Roseibium marinum]